MPLTREGTLRADADWGQVQYIDIVPITGEIRGELRCQLEHRIGILYVGENALYFKGAFSFFDKKLTLPWQSVRKIVPHNAGGGGGGGDVPEASPKATTTPSPASRDDGADKDQPSPTAGGECGEGLRVVCHDDTVHTFCGFESRERALLLLQDLHNDSLFSSHAIRGGGEEKTTTEADALDGTGTAAETTTANANHHEAASSEQKDWTSALERRMVDGIKVLDLLGMAQMDPVSCRHDNVSGFLYAGENGIYFRERFFWDRKDTFLPWTTVGHIQRVDSQKTVMSDVIASQGERQPKGMRIRLKGKHHHLYFMEIKNVNKVWKAWVNLCKVANSRANALFQSPSSSMRRENFRRLRMSALKENSSNNDMIPDSNHDTNADEKDLNTDSHDSKSVDESLDCDGDNKTRSAPNQTQLSFDENTKPSFAEKSPSKPKTHALQWNDAICEEFEHVVVRDLVLQCSLDEFFRFFVQDEAEYSIVRFLEDRGDRDLAESPWEDQSVDGVEAKAVANNGDGGGADDEDDAGVVTTRNRLVNYTHPITIPMAPPQASARKEQLYQRFGNVGIIVETKTFVNDVPMADCFYVTDRIRAAHAEGGLTEVTLEFDISFVKLNMFQSVIKKTSENEFKDLLCAMSEYFVQATHESAAVQAETKRLRMSKRMVEVKPKPTESTPRRPDQFLYLALLLLTMIQLWILMEVRTLSGKVSELQQNGHRTCDSKDFTAV